MLMHLTAVLFLLVATRGDPVRIDTTTDFSYIHVEPRGISIESQSNVTFTVKATNDAHVALSQYPDDLGIATYEIVIGGWKNTKSVIRRCVNCNPESFRDHEPLNSSEYHPFWISWNDGILRCGTGRDVGDNEFVRWFDRKPHNISYMSVSTGWGSNGSWGFRYVDGDWSAWTTWSSCSVSCGYGIHHRSRVCDNPQPVYGRYCNGHVKEVENCQDIPCVVKGAWSTWGTWVECSMSCNTGMTSRRRSCESVVAGMDHTACHGDGIETKLCVIQPCPVDGNWISWSEWSACSFTCGRGVRARNRTCTAPFPQHGGRPCLGNWTQDQICNGPVCPEAGYWSLWTAWSNCSRMCDRGTRVRRRMCNKAPSSEECPGNDTHSIDCNFMTCPVDQEDGVSEVKDRPVEAPGAVGLGIVGFFMILAFVALVIVLDLMTLPKHFQMLKRNLSHACCCAGAGKDARVSRYRSNKTDVADGQMCDREGTDRRVAANNAFETTRRRRCSNGEIDLHAQYEHNWAGCERECGSDAESAGKSVRKESWNECVSKHNSTLYIRNDTSRLQTAHWDLIYLNAFEEIRPQLLSTRL